VLKPASCEQWADLHVGEDVQMVQVRSLGGLHHKNGALPPEFLAKSAHIFGNFVRKCSGWGGTEDCPRSERLSLHLLNIEFLGISVQGPNISHTILRIIENRVVPTGVDVILSC
jgi:hypothetical protein